MTRPSVTSLDDRHPTTSASSMVRAMLRRRDQASSTGVRMQQEVFDRLVGALYGTVVDPSSWQRVLRDLRAAFDASQTTLVSGRPMAGRIRNHCWTTEPALTEAFNRWCVRHERLPVSSVNLKVGEVATDHHVVERKSLTKTPYFNEVLVPFEASKLMFIKLAESPGPTLNVLRGDRHADFDDADLAQARRLSYHAVQAVRGLASLGGTAWTDLVAAVDDVDEGIVLVDDTGAVIHANPPARSLLAAHDGVRTHGCRLGATDHRADRRLRQAIWSATEGPVPRSGSMLAIARSSGARSLVVGVTPVAERAMDLGLVPRLAAIVSILNPERGTATSMSGALLQTFGITRREAAVVDALVAGMTVAEAATHCNVTLATARNYLARVLRKADLNRQGDLVMLVQRLSRLRETSRLATGPASRAQADNAL